MNRTGASGWATIAPHCSCSSAPPQICVVVNPLNVEFNGSPASVTLAGVSPLLNRVPVAGVKV